MQKITNTSNGFVVKEKSENIFVINKIRLAFSMTFLDFFFLAFVNIDVKNHILISS